MHHRGEALAVRVVDAVEDHLTAVGLLCINRLARARRVSPHHLAVCVPGLCHTHGPDGRPAVPGCAYCRRRGNCFGN